MPTLAHMRTPPPYTPDPALANTRISYPDIEAILACGGRGFVRNSDAVMHFVRRVQLTMRLLIDQNNQLRGVIENQRIYRVVGTPTTLDPMDAAKFLSPEQKASLFEGLKADGLAKLRRREETLAKAQTRCTSLAAQAELVMSIAADEMSPATRDKVVAAIADLLATATPDAATAAAAAAAEPAPAPAVEQPPASAPEDAHDLADLWDGPDAPKEER